MKLPQIGLRALNQTSSGLLNSLWSRRCPVDTKCGTPQGVRFSSKLIADLRRLVSLTKVTNKAIRDVESHLASPKKKDNGNQIKNASSPPPTAESFIPETNNKLPSLQHKRRLRDAVVDKQSTDQAKERRPDDKRTRKRTAKFQRAVSNTKARQDGRNVRSNSGSLKIRRVLWPDNQRSVVAQMTGKVLSAPTGTSGASYTNQMPSIQRSSSTQLVTRAERRELLQLVSNLKEVLSYIASEEQIEFKEEPAKNSGTSQTDNEEDQASMKMFPVTTTNPLSSRSILAAYLDLQARRTFLSPQDHDNLLLQLFDQQTMEYLWKNGYDIEDVVAWAWILSARSDYYATSRLLLWTNRPMPKARVPAPILGFLLERNIRDRKVVQLLTIHLWHRLDNHIDSSWETLYNKFTSRSALSHEKSSEQEAVHLANYPKIEPHFGPERLLISISRLMMMAIKWAYTLLPSLATMLCEHIKGQESSASAREDNISFRSSVWLTTRFNDILVLLARQTEEPYISIAYQERAQFIIIRYMNEFKPPLILGQHAYRSVVSVQLRHRKTLKDRYWAELKSRGWPPYREDKLGVDAKKKDEVYGMSRAQQAIINLQEAGYAKTMWEHSASVLSGWDVDRSPTIQIRTYFAPESPVDEKDQDDSTNQSKLWEARVLSTRTIEEAWAAFLNYMEEDIQRKPGVFLAMFEKIALERSRKQDPTSTQDTVSSKALPGDMPGVWPSSPNPREMVYTPSPPPSYEEFYHRYRDQFPILNQRALCFLLFNAESLEQGHNYVRASTLSLQQQDILLQYQASDRIDKCQLPMATLTAYARHLSQFPSLPLPNNHLVSALSHAISLVYSQNPRWHRPWFFVLKALDLQIQQSKSQKRLWIWHWKTVTEFIRRMESAGINHDSDTIRYICSIFDRLLFLASQGIENEPHDKTEIQKDYHNIMMDAAQQLKKILNNLFSLNVSDESWTIGETPFWPPDRPEHARLRVSTQSKTVSLLPQLLYVPAPATLHYVVKLLGIIGDRKTVIELLNWMSSFSPEIQVKVDELAGGKRHFRWILIAVRIIVETSVRPFIGSMNLSQLTNSDSEHAREAKSIVEKIDSWEGWPDDDEVVKYMQHHLRKETIYHDAQT